MRQKLNENPMAQVGVVLVLLVIVAIFLLKGMGGGEEGAAPTEATVAVEGSGVSGTATGATPGEAVEGAVEAATEELAGSTSDRGRSPRPCRRRRCRSRSSPPTTRARPWSCWSSTTAASTTGWHGRRWRA